MMQHRMVTPNLHFRTLNPTVAPFYTHLEIPTCLVPWPMPPAGQPLRASVNSFGFGGTNAHAILESYEPDIHNHGPWSKHIHIAPKSNGDIYNNISAPLFFSASSQSALAAMVLNFSKYLTDQDLVNLRDLAYTLSSRRSAFPYRVSFAGTGKSDLVAKMLKRLNNGPEIGFRVKAGNSANRILGIFTGQGAQW